MNAARDQILGAVRSGLRRAVLPDADAEAVALPRAGREDPPALWESFTRALTALTGRVHHAASPGQAAEIVGAIAAEHGAEAFLSWDDDQLACEGLIALLASRDLRRVDYDLAFEPAARASQVPALGEIVLGLTGSDAAIADAGAIVLASGPGRGRLASLLPPVHVAVASAARIWPSLPALLADEPDLIGRGANTVIIAGPSRTADIEMTLTRGVHGPKHLHVIVMP